MFHPIEELKKLPNSPGVYMFMGESDEIIYVGKAINLKNRVRSYFSESALSERKIQGIRLSARKLEHIVTDTEVEALILECNLIKEHQPRYNVKLKDDTSYPYIKVTINEDFPRIFITRNYEEDGSKYFGPYTSSFAVSEVLDVLLKLWPLKRSSKTLKDGVVNGRPCLNYHIGLCPGPCGIHIRKEEYALRVNSALEFLNGKFEHIIDGLKLQMLAASDALEFEAAANFRDKIAAIKRLNESQKIDRISSGDQDIIAFAKNENEALVQVFFIRDGKMTGREHFMLSDIADQSNRQIMTSFVTQFYSGTPYIPKELILQFDIEESELIKKWLAQEKGRQVRIIVPQKGEKRGLLRLAENNAIVSLAAFGERIKKEVGRTTGAMQEIGDALGIPNIYRIEAYDISNIQGFENVGSMVVFEEGKPRRSDYRKFKIKSIHSPNDYASMQEVLYRRFKRYEKEKNEGIAPETAKFSRLPDVIFIDGGRGHITAAKEVLGQLGISIPICGMVKNDKHKTRGLLYEGEEVLLPTQNEGFKLIARIQEEVHRFAIEYHRNLRQKTSVKSALDDIPGIGPARRRALLKHFGDIQAIKSASQEELASVDLMNKKSAESVFAFFRT